MGLLACCWVISDRFHGCFVIALCWFIKGFLFRCWFIICWWIYSSLTTFHRGFSLACWPFLIWYLDSSLICLQFIVCVFACVSLVYRWFIWFWNIVSYWMLIGLLSVYHLGDCMCIGLSLHRVFFNSLTVYRFNICLLDALLNYDCLAFLGYNWERCFVKALSLLSRLRLMASIGCVASTKAGWLWNMLIYFDIS